MVFCVILLSLPHRGNVVGCNYCTDFSKNCFFSWREGKGSVSNKGGKEIAAKEKQCFSHIKRFEIAPHCQVKIRLILFYQVLPAVSSMHTSVPEGVETLTPV